MKAGDRQQESLPTLVDEEHHVTNLDLEIRGQDLGLCEASGVGPFPARSPRFDSSKSTENFEQQPMPPIGILMAQ
eukprot:CAMPEP_0171563320 /NCGR_PEP_ID=MMETSP0960-20121227/15589_1 /TAXON_ID=87120 /ORGANISM="Aurantiochytrium limacinum, Strain ATCCMYA-1381" /LENGTH=74 /DNA_ID=CAMNT_0012116423 /DNA_START=283 /DNA_END=504 /DNA_ORIENTATION=-